MEQETTSTTTTTPNGDEDLLRGYQFGQTYRDKSPLDFMSDPETGLRPGTMTGYQSTQKPSGCAVVDLSEGIKNWHVIPPVAIWRRGKWFDTLDKAVQNTIRIDAWDERETWVVSGEGTPGNYILRAYVVPVKVADNQDPKHPVDWTDKQKKKGDDKGTIATSGWSLGQQTQAKKPEPPKPPPLPAGIHFRCTGCGHWFGSETRFGGHSSHCCPGSANWGPEGSDWILECECCDTFEETAVCKPGYPRLKPETKDGEKEKEAVA